MYDLLGKSKNQWTFSYNDLDNLINSFAQQDEIIDKKLDITKKERLDQLKEEVEQKNQQLMAQSQPQSIQLQPIIQKEQEEQLQSKLKKEEKVITQKRFIWFKGLTIVIIQITIISMVIRRKNNS